MEERDKIENVQNSSEISNIDELFQKKLKEVTSIKESTVDDAVTKQ